jgi:hypothetical protein
VSVLNQCFEDHLGHHQGYDDDDDDDDEEEEEEEEDDDDNDDLDGIERIVLLDSIHHLVSQKTNKIVELRIWTKYHNTHVHKIHTRVNY